MTQQRIIGSKYLKQVWPRLRVYATFLMMGSILIFITQYVIQNWALVRDHQWQLDWTWLVVAVLGMLAFYAGLALGWHRLITWNGALAPWTANFWVWSRSSLARYLPTPVWMVASRVYLTTEFGTSWRNAVLTYQAELVVSLGGAFGIALLALTVWIDLSPVVCIFIAGTSIFAILPLIYLLSLRLLRYFNLFMKCDLTSMVGWSLQYSITFLIFGVAHLFVLKSLVDTLPPIHLVIGISALAWALGTLNIFSPSGLGTREIIVVYGLRDYVGMPELLTFGVVSRLVSISGELLLFVMIYGLIGVRPHILVRTRKNKPFPEQNH